MPVVFELERRLYFDTPLKKCCNTYKKALNSCFNICPPGGDWRLILKAGQIQVYI